MDFLWQFDGGEPNQCPLEALETAQGDNLLQPAVIDCGDLFRIFARQCALDVLHLWDVPDTVREYLETGDELLRSFAHDAVQNATTKSTAFSPKWSAMWCVTRDPTIAPAYSTARNTAWAVAWIHTEIRAKNAARARQSQRLTTLFAAQICPVPQRLKTRLEEHRRIRYEPPELLPLYPGTSWSATLPGLDLIEISQNSKALPSTPKPSPVAAPQYRQPLRAAAFPKRIKDLLLTFTSRRKS